MHNEFEAADAVDKKTGFVRELGLFDSSMIVIGSMIGSGIFIVPADMARNLGSGGWLLVAWLFTAVVTVAAALSYGELAALFPKAGGMYIYLREAFSPLIGFLYGWTLFTVIQTGTIAAVAVAFARYTGVLIPAISESRYLIQPVHISQGYAVSLSTGQVVAIFVIVLLTWANSQGVKYGKVVQNLFTSAKIVALAALILLGVIFFKHAAAAANFGQFWTPQGVTPLTSSLSAMTGFGLFVALCVSQSGSLFSADSWHDITFAGGEVRDPARTMPLALTIGTASVTALYVLANLAYLLVLPMDAIKNAPADRVGALMLQVILPGSGSLLMSIAIMISTFGCINGLVLAGPRVFYSMARDGLFPKAAGQLNKANVPGWSLAIQGLWATLLILPRTNDPQTHSYGNLYSNLLDYVISAALIFYILTIAGVLRLRATRPAMHRPYRAWGFPVVPLVYIVGCSVVLFCLFAYRPATTWPGLLIVVIGLPIYWWVKRRRVGEASSP